MKIETKYGLDQEVFLIVPTTIKPGSYLAVKHHIKAIHIQPNSENKPWIRYYLALQSGLYRECDLYPTKLAALDFINNKLNP